MLRLLLAAALALLGASQLALAGYCDELDIPPCEKQVPRDIMFLVDISRSMDVERFYADVLNYTLQLYCAFDPELQNKAGVIVFAEQVDVVVPLRRYTEDEWFAEIYRLKDSRYTDEPICCSCCTPTGDAFVLAEQHMAERATHETQLVFVITDGLPSNNNPDTGGQPEWWFFDPETGYDPSLYNTKAVPEAAWLLKNSGRRVILLGVPNYLGVPPDAKYFDGGFRNNFNYCLRRQGVDFCTPYYTEPVEGNPEPHFPIVSLPVSQNSFTQNRWGDDDLLNEIIESICFVPPTPGPTKLPTSDSPTSRYPTEQPTAMPTKEPTKQPTSQAPTPSPVGLVLEQVDLTFLVDRSNSMTYYDDLCNKVLDTFPPGNRGPVPCWDLWIKFLNNQVADFLKIPAGEDGRRELGWRSQYGDATTPRKGLRVSVIGFACKNKQKTPLLFEFSQEIVGGRITSQAQMEEFMAGMRQIVPTGGTCPHLAVEQAVKYLETVDREKYPLQAVLLMTDGIFYDGNAVPRATKGLKKYRALRYSVGVAVSSKGNKHGMTEEEQRTQRKQLQSFVDGDSEFFYNVKNGYDGLLEITETLAQSLPNYYFRGGKPPIPNYTWCGFRRKFNCASDNWRMNNCKWTGGGKAQYKCKKKK